MSIWRPSSNIRVKALGLHWRGGRLLAAEVYSDRGAVKGVRPLGGSVNFGERADHALLREFREELGIAVSILGKPLVMESIYDHEGHAGHEVLFIYEVAFPDGAYAGQDRVLFCEDNGVPGIASWYELDDLDREGCPALYPAGLKGLLANRT